MKSVKELQKWNNVNGKMNVWANVYKTKKGCYVNFSTSIFKKTEDEEFKNVYFDVLFKKDEAPKCDEGNFNINVKAGFLTVKEYQDGTLHPAVMVMDYDVLD